MSATRALPSVIVIDASLAIWAALPVVAGVDVDVIERFERWRREGRRLAAPILWLAESTSGIRRSVYSRAITTENGRAALEDLFAMGVSLAPLDPPLCRSAFEWADRLKQSRAYDGFYVALAEQMRTEFWTADRRLANAANQAGANWVHWIGESAAAL